MAEGGAKHEARAYASKGEGKPFEPWTYEKGELPSGEVEVRVTHNGLCHTDIHMQNNDWHISTFPLVAGHEVVGIVENVGSQVTHLKKGDKVAFGWISDSCRACGACIKGEENICLKGYQGLILGGNHGGFQEFIRASADFAIPVPEGLPSSAAAPLMCAGITVYAPLRGHWKRPGMKVGVLGIGGLGHLALQFAKAMGAEVTAFSTSKNKEEEARKFGAHHFITYNPNAVSGEGYGIDPENKVELLLNCSPALPPEGDFRNQMSLVQTDGTLVLAGIPNDSLAKVSLLDIIFSQKKLAGSIVGGRRLLKEMLEFCATHNIRPQVQLMKLSQMNEAIKIVEENRARYRIVLENDF